MFGSMCWQLEETLSEIRVRGLHKTERVLTGPVVGFWYPVVPEAAARIRSQLSAAQEREELDPAIGAFTEIRKEMAS